MRYLRLRLLLCFFLLLCAERHTRTQTEDETKPPIALRLVPPLHTP